MVKQLLAVVAVCVWSSRELELLSFEHCSRGEREGEGRGSEGEQ